MTSMVTFPLLYYAEQIESMIYEMIDNMSYIKLRMLGQISYDPRSYEQKFAMYDTLHILHTVHHSCNPHGLVRTHK